MRATRGEGVGGVECEQLLKPVPLLLREGVQQRPQEVGSCLAVLRNLLRSTAVLFQPSAPTGGSGIVPPGQEEVDEELVPPAVLATNAPDSSWPGKYATTVHLLRKRAAAKRRREQADDATEVAPDERQGGGPSDASSSECDDLSEVHLHEQDEDGDVRAAKAPRRSPDNAAELGASPSQATTVLVAGGGSRRHWLVRYGVPEVTWRPQAPPPQASPFQQATPTSHPHLVQRRGRAALTSGDGFALVEEVHDVPPLSALCLAALTRSIEQVDPEAVALLPGSLRHTLVHATAAARRLHSGTSHLFVPLRAMRGASEGDVEPGDDLTLPDCSSVDDVTLREALSVCAGHLHTLSLGHCGRCLSDYSVKLLLAEGASSPFASLRQLSLRGPYSLSGDGLRAILADATSLTSLQVTAAPLIAADVLRDLPSLAPKLQALSLSNCHKAGDVSLGVQWQAGATGGSSPSDTAEQDTQVLELDAMVVPFMLKHGRGPAPLPPGRTLPSQCPTSGLLGLPNLNHLHLEGLPAVSDALFDCIAAAAAEGKLQLKSLVLRQLENVTDHALHVLGGRSAPRLGSTAPKHVPVEPLAGGQGLPPAPVHLTTLVLHSMPHVSDKGLRSAARCLRGDALRLGVLECPQVKKEPSILRLLRAATSPSAPTVPEPKDSVQPSDGIMDFGFGQGGAEGGVAPHDELSASGLQRLQLCSLPCLSDASLAFLTTTGAPLSLRRIDLSWCRGCTDAGVGMLADACPQLESLSVWGCTQLTAELFEGLQAEKVRGGIHGDGMMRLAIRGRPGSKLPVPEFELSAWAGASQGSELEVHTMPEVS